MTSNKTATANFITADDPPMYFFHGQQDLLVPVESPTEMVKLLRRLFNSEPQIPMPDVWFSTFFQLLALGSRVWRTL
jgi:hypothetical protein